MRSRRQTENPIEFAWEKAGIDEGLAHTRQLKNLRKADKPFGDPRRRNMQVGLLLKDQPRNPVLAWVLDFWLFLRLHMRLIYDKLREVGTDVLVLSLVAG